MAGARTPSGLTLIVRFADDTEEAFAVPPGTRLRASLRDGWWIFKLLDGREVGWTETELKRVEVGAATPDAVE